jgi:glucokinase
MQGISKKWSIGIDLGGTKINGARVDETGKIIESRKVKTDVKGGPRGIIRQINELVEVLCKDQDESPLGVGVGVAGLVSETGGFIYFAPNLQWDDVPFEDMLEENMTHDAFVLNDVRAAAYAEWQVGAGRHFNDLVCVFIGTGIGGCVISDGRLLSGANNSFGELGHTTLDFDGPPCHCNNVGCFEALASGWAIEREARTGAAADAEGANLLLNQVDGHLNQITGKMVIQAANSGDPFSKEIIDRVEFAIAGGITSVVNGYNPAKIILGGGIMEGLASRIPSIEKQVKARALDIAGETVQITGASLHNEAGVIGAALYSMKKFNETIL